MLWLIFGIIFLCLDMIRTVSSQEAVLEYGFMDLNHHSQPSHSQPSRDQQSHDQQRQAQVMVSQ